MGEAVTDVHWFFPGAYYPLAPLTTHSYPAHNPLRDSIKQWLIRAPILLATGQSGAEGLDIEQIEGEGQLRPKAGETRSIGGGELKWREVVLEDYLIDFNARLGHETTQSVAYAVCYIRSETEQRGLRMLVGSDDQAKVDLNGRQVYKSLVGRHFFAEQDTVQEGMTLAIPAHCAGLADD